MDNPDYTIEHRKGQHCECQRIFEPLANEKMSQSSYRTGNPTCCKSIQWMTGGHSRLVYPKAMRERSVKAAQRGAAGALTGR